MFTFSFTAQQTGYFTDMASFYFTDNPSLTELVVVNNQVFDAERGELFIQKENSASILRPQFHLFSHIENKTTNIGTITDPIKIEITPSQSGQFSLSASSSDTNLLPADAFSFWVDEDATKTFELPHDATTGEPVMVYLTVTPAPDVVGTATVSIEAFDAGDPAKSTETDFDLTVALADAHLGVHNGTTSYTNTSAVTLKGEKARGSTILLQVDGQDPVEIVGGQVAGDWTYDWDLPDGDGSYGFTVLNQAGGVSEAFGSGTMVLDTQIPEVPITEREIIGVSYGLNKSDAHRLEVRAQAPDMADSNRYRLCATYDDGIAYIGGWQNYAATERSATITAQDGMRHTSAFAMMDQAGNTQAACMGEPVTWRFDANRTLMDTLRIDAVAAAGADSAHVRFVWNYNAAIGGDVRVWVRTRDANRYQALSGAPFPDESENNWVFEDFTASTLDRSYLLTNNDATTVLARFALGQEAHTEPVLPSQETPAPPGPAPDNGGGGGCFISTMAF
ncbi:MAG: hypothetical protein HKP58_14430 [Desulfatitalea sp.]|nr:hypothetical protein [Desulfatitalea sp.]